MPESMSALARSLEYWREIRGLSQAQLSQKAGLADSAVNDILRSPDRSPRLSTVEKLAGALDITLWQLLSPPGSAAGQVAAANQPQSPGGVVVIGPESFTKGDRLIIAEYAEALSFDPEAALIGMTLEFDSIAFGFVPGTPVLIFPIADYANEVVAVADGDSSQVSFRYYAPPWLFGFRSFGVPFHEFAGRPGLTILGAVRTRAHVEAALGRPFPPVSAESAGGIQHVSEKSA
jgi:transcriptional regulator with XRE-family HTH domain